MGVILERARIAEDLLANMQNYLADERGPRHLGSFGWRAVGCQYWDSGRHGRDHGGNVAPYHALRWIPTQFGHGTICATGTLGQIIPPSIALVPLGDIISGAYQRPNCK